MRQRMLLTDEIVGVKRKFNRMCPMYNKAVRRRHVIDATAKHLVIHSRTHTQPLLIQVLFHVFSRPEEALIFAILNK